MMVGVGIGELPARIQPVAQREEIRQAPVLRAHRLRVEREHLT